ncbi:MAG TPA: NifU family protein [Deltaproteobacteria bacterium]|nr:NifU family protein [Deltaproteobacteria bacterium]
MNIERKTVENVLAKTRPMLQRDGGDVELVDITEDGIVKIRLKGACNGCPMATMTLKSVIERVLKNEMPEVKQVQQVL